MISEIQFNADLGKSDHLLQYFFILIVTMK